MLYTLRKSLVAAGFLTALAMPPVHAVSPDELFEVLQRIEALENEVRFLRGENEQLRYDIEDVRNTQKSTFIRIDDRMDDLFRAVNSSTSKMSAPVDPSLLSPIKKLRPQSATLPQVKAPVSEADSNSVQSVAAVSPAATKSVPTSMQVAPVSLSKKRIQGEDSAEQAAYKAALSKVKIQPASAMTQFRSFLKKYPTSSLAANAQYWLGEMMYSSRNYNGAIDEFVTVLQKYGGSAKAADAAVKLGFSFYETKNWVYARRTLEDVLRHYPKTNAATLAQARLTKMKTANLY